MTELLPLLSAAVLAGLLGSAHCLGMCGGISGLFAVNSGVATLKTQLPYALTVGGVAILLGTLPTSFGVPTWICFPLSIGALYGVLRYWGKEVPEPKVKA